MLDSEQVTEESEAVRKSEWEEVNEDLGEKRLDWSVYSVANRSD